MHDLNRFKNFEKKLKKKNETKIYILGGDVNKHFFSKKTHQAPLSGKV